MDIQVSSNFERLLFEMNDRDGLRTAEQLARFRQSGRLGSPPSPPAVDRRAVPGGRFDDAEVAAEIRRVHDTTGLLIDPHTATATAAARRLGGDHPVVTMATAHAAKFPDAVEHATGIRPQLPEHLADLLASRNKQVLPNDLAAVEEFVSVAFAREAKWK